MPLRRDTLVPYLALGVGVLLIGCWNVALLLIPAADATLMGNTAPLWVGLVAWLWLGGIYLVNSRKVER